MTTHPTDAQIEAISYTAQDLQDIRDGIWLCPAEFMPGHGLAPYIYTRKILLSALAAEKARAEKALKDDTLRTTALAILWWLAPPWDGCQAALKSKAFKCPNDPSACMCIMAAKASRVSRLLPAEVSGREAKLVEAARPIAMMPGLWSGSPGFIAQLENALSAYPSTTAQESIDAV